MSDLSIRVLMLEDDLDYVTVVQHGFSKEQNPSFQLTGVDSVKGCCDYLAENKTDVILLDLNVKDSRGLDTFMKVHGVQETVPILILTGVNDTGLAIEAVRLGAQDYLLKEDVRVKTLPRIIMYAIERKRAEMRIRETQQRYRTVFENSPAAIMVTDALERVVSWNKYTEKLLGKGWEDLFGKDVSTLYPAEEWEKIRAEGIRNKGLQHHLETKMLTREAGTVDVDISISVLKDASGKVSGSIGIIRDISERKALEKEKEKKQKELQAAYEELGKTTQMLVQTEKMSAIGVLAAGIAHELNNPMMGVINFIQYCKKHTPPEDRRYQVLADAEHEALRCIEIIRDLLTSSREGHGGEAKQLENCETVFERVLRLLTHRIGKEGVAVRRHYSGRSPQVLMDAGEIQQVFLNLATNALDAMSSSAKKQLDVTVGSNGTFVTVEVQDTGCGIAPELIYKIFNPFFTTKPFGEGTGLGLSISQGIVQKMGGEIRCESRPGEGAKFIVLLPAGQEEGEGHEKTDPGD